MKKIISLLLTMAMIFCLAACGQDSQVPEEHAAPTQATQPTPTQAATQPQEEVREVYSFTYNGVEIAMHAPAADIVAALGEPKSYTEEASCAFDGMDKTYYYGPFYMQTYPMDGVDYIYCLWLVDDTVTTAEGLYIGCDQALAESVCGAESFNGTNAYVVAKGESTLTVILDGAAVYSIQYDAVVN